MQKSRVWMFFVALAGLCWGVYVPLVAEGGKELHSAFAAFLCVGGAYFLLAVLLPIIILAVRGKWPAWNARGVTLSTLAGVAGAAGALCVIFATVVFPGPPMFVAPVIFALAPVINTIVSLFWHPDEGAFTVGAPREPVHWSLYLGVVLAGLGAALVLLAKDLPGILAGKPIEVKNYTFVIFVLLAGLSLGRLRAADRPGRQGPEKLLRLLPVRRRRLLRHRRRCCRWPCCGIRAPSRTSSRRAVGTDRRHPRHAVRRRPAPSGRCA